MSIYKQLDHSTDNLFAKIIEYFSKDPDSASLAWYIFITRSVPKSYRISSYKVLVKIARNKLGVPKKRPPYNALQLETAINVNKEIIKWIQNKWLLKKHKNMNINSLSSKKEMFYLLKSTLDNGQEYAILYNNIVNWEPFNISKKQTLPK